VHHGEVNDQTDWPAAARAGSANSSADTAHHHFPTGNFHWNFWIIQTTHRPVIPRGLLPGVRSKREEGNYNEYRRHDPVDSVDHDCSGLAPWWPYSRGWGYYPSGSVGLILIIVIVLLVLGVI